jgi:hypothetical protein
MHPDIYFDLKINTSPEIILFSFSYTEFSCFQKITSYFLCKYLSKQVEEDVLTRLPRIWRSQACNWNLSHAFLKKKSFLHQLTSCFYSARIYFLRAYSKMTFSFIWFSWKSFSNSGSEEYLPISNHLLSLTELSYATGHVTKMMFSNIEKTRLKNNEVFDISRRNN